VFCPRCGRQFAASRAYCLDCGIKLGRSISTSAFRSKGTTKVGMILEKRFQLVGLMGQGASSRVYLADDLEKKQPVALKLFASSALGGKERFLGEAKSFMAVRHPNVLRLVHVGDHLGSPFLVLELLQGETLGDYLKREGKPPLPLGLDLLRQAAAGLAAAHAAGVVHRDVKPDNLFLIGEVGDPFGLKVIDFGLARGQKSGTSTAGLVVGTLAYIAPEQVLSEPVDARSDVYALGVVLHRCLTGRLPFEQESDVDLVAHQLFAPAPRDSRLDARVSRVLATALRKAPENRYPTMEAMRNDLEKLVGLRPGEVLGAPLASLPDLYKPQSPGGRAAVAALKERFDATQGDGPPAR
jgi:serine/threonine-protein kinase